MNSEYLTNTNVLTQLKITVKTKRRALSSVVLTLSNAASEAAALRLNETVPGGP